jgi:hypothetical protein
MSLKIYLAVYAIACPGGKTVPAGKPIQLTDEQAERLLAKGAVTFSHETEESEEITGNLMTMPDAEFVAAISAMKVADLKAAVEGMALEAGNAKTKADFIVVIQAAREKAAQQSGT